MGHPRATKNHQKIRHATLDMWSPPATTVAVLARQTAGTLTASSPTTLKFVASFSTTAKRVPWTFAYRRGQEETPVSVKVRMCGSNLKCLEITTASQIKKICPKGHFPKTQVDVHLLKNNTSENLKLLAGRSYLEKTGETDGGMQNCFCQFAGPTACSSTARSRRGASSRSGCGRIRGQSAPENLRHFMLFMLKSP